MMNVRLLGVLLLTGMSLSASRSAAGPVLIGQTLYTHNTGLNEWANDGAHVAGQTFRTPDSAHTVLTSFSFEFSVRRADLDYEAFVYEFNTSNSTNSGPALVGSALFSSGRRDTGDGTANAPTFTGLNIALSSGKQYVAFLSTLGLNDGMNVFGALKSTDNGDYSQGQMFKPYTSNSFADLLALRNTFGAGSADLVFSMTFEEPTAPAPVPDSGPGVFALITLTLASAFGRRSRSQSRE